MVGVTDTDLKDENTAKFIYEFVEQHGGIEKANQQLEDERKKVPPPPPRNAPPSPPSCDTRPPPPPSQLYNSI